MGLFMSFFIFMYLCFLLFFFQFTSSSRQPLCHDDERFALLRFKESFVINCTFASYNPSAYPKAASWDLKGNSDCCSWDGVKCNEDTGYVIKLDLSSSCLYGSLNSTGNTLFKLIHLQWLSLAYNDFNDSEIPYDIKNLSKLSHLNLSDSVVSGKIPLEMQELSNLESLDLSKNLLQLQQSGLEGLVEKLINLKVLDLDWVNISSSLPQVLTNFSSLKFLSLSDCQLEGTIPSLIGNLTNLIHLDLSFNYNLEGIIPSSIGDLINLTHLNLVGSNLKGVIPSSMGDLTNLTYLDLSNSYFEDVIPFSMGDLTNLTYLDLSQNYFQGIIPFSLGNLSNIIHLDLSSNNFGSDLPTSMGNLGSLEVLNINGCNLFVEDSSFLSNLTQLNYLDVSYNHISSPRSPLSWIGKHTKLTSLYLSGINISEIPFWLMNLTQLTVLAMTTNQLVGPIPSWLMKLNHIETLDLGYNQLTDQIPSQISNLTQLNYLDLSSNQLQGSIPSSFFELNNLEYLDLSSNNLSGTMELEMFPHKFKSLRSLDLSSNNLSLLTNSIFNISSHIYSLRLQSCNLHSFPNFLRNLDGLSELDLSSNNISGQIPRWLLNINKNGFQVLSLSHNLLTGFDQQPVIFPWTNLWSVDLRFNKLRGPLPISPISTIGYYLVSNNELSGELPPWICKLNSLQALDLSNNNFSGKLPQCLGNFSNELSMLNLQNNKFHGSIPQTFMNGMKLRMIDLSNNMLQGEIPRSLANCTMLEFLDLGNNSINGTFPSWIRTLPKLEVLNLQSNNFHGIIEEPKSDFDFPKLRIIDLSQNKFTGRLPSKYFESWNSMKLVDESQRAYMMKSSNDSNFYDYSLRMVNKGVVIEYEMILNTLVSICLSNNRFEGQIPASISILKGLRYLNLSNNNLIGGIPPSLDNLTVLESLDLSNNNLSGEIPSQLVKLSPLAFFDVSDNNLAGPIPQGPQFNTFSSSSFEGNPGLCGQPLPKKCGNSEPPQKKQKEDDQISESLFAFGWTEVATGYASGIIFGVGLGHIFCTMKLEWFEKIFRMPLKRVVRKRRRLRN